MVISQRFPSGDWAIADRNGGKRIGKIIVEMIVSPMYTSSSRSRYIAISDTIETIEAMTKKNTLIREFDGANLVNSVGFTEN